MLMATFTNDTFLFPYVMLFVFSACPPFSFFSPPCWAPSMCLRELFLPPPNLFLLWAAFPWRASNAAGCRIALLASLEALRRGGTAAAGGGGSEGREEGGEIRFQICRTSLSAFLPISSPLPEEPGDRVAELWKKTCDAAASSSSSNGASVHGGALQPINNRLLRRLSFCMCEEVLDKRHLTPPKKQKQKNQGSIWLNGRACKCVPQCLFAIGANLPKQLKGVYFYSMVIMSVFREACSSLAVCAKQTGTVNPDLFMFARFPPCHKEKMLSSISSGPIHVVGIPFPIASEIILEGLSKRNPNFSGGFLFMAVAFLLHRGPGGETLRLTTPRRFMRPSR